MDREFGREDYDPEDEGSFEPDLVFLIMPFASADSKDVHAVIRDACKRVGLRTTRVDDSGGSGFVIKEVAELIERAEFIVCDLSYERPNVYYELGYAHGVGNEADEILLIAKAGTKLHFDIAPLRVHYFDDLTSLGILVEQQMLRMIEVTRA